MKKLSELFLERKQYKDGPETHYNQPNKVLHIEDVKTYGEIKELETISAKSISPKTRIKATEKLHEIALREGIKDFKV